MTSDRNLVIFVKFLLKKYLSAYFDTQTSERYWNRLMDIQVQLCKLNIHVKSRQIRIKPKVIVFSQCSLCLQHLLGSPHLYEQFLKTTKYVRYNSSSSP